MVMRNLKTQMYEIVGVFSWGAVSSKQYTSHWPSEAPKHTIRNLH